MGKKAVILFSGGLDSTTVLAHAAQQGYECFPISFQYGQRHNIELEAAKRIVKTMGITHHQVIELPSHMFGPSALTSKEIEVPAYQKDKDIPVTYVPARNTIFLAISLGYAESLGASDIFIGVSAIDYSNYPDCRPEFIKAFEQMANLGTKGALSEKITIHTPLINLTKAETIQLGMKYHVDYSVTVSCYQADTHTGAACGICHSCMLRKKGFAEAQVTDPTLYL